MLQTSPTAQPSARRILTASFVGTAIEFYDFYIYATAAALVIGPVFFPPGEPGVQLLAAFATFAIASWPGRSGRRCSGISATASAARRRWWPR